MVINAWIDVAVGDEQILPAVVVEINEAVAEPNKGNGCGTDSHVVTRIGQESRTVICEEQIVIIRKCSIHDSQVPIVLIVADRDPHIRFLASIPVEGVSI